ncbi:hypothetical protein [Pseudanabaena minima]|uniref:hypothetical protein n=1 Tax=Pseudanabaena minima TaxID=890415 RepID=UPI003DA8AE6D
MLIEKIESKKFYRFSRISLCVITFTALSAPSFLNLDSQQLEARPCKKTWFGRLGCALDPTNPERNGGIVQPYVVKPVQKAVKRYAARVTCGTAGAVTGAALASSGFGTGLTVVGGTLVSEGCYKVWEQ